MTDGSTEEQIEPARWVDRYGDCLYRYALSRLRDVGSAEEIVQETSVAALRNIDQYAGKGAERAWLLGILKRKIIDQIRKRNRIRPTESTDAADDVSELVFDQKGCWKTDLRLFGSDPGAPLEQAELWKVFQDCLQSLPQRQADAFTLRELDEKSSAEVCKDMDISASNLWVLLYRARLRLAKCMKARWLTEGGR